MGCDIFSCNYALPRSSSCVDAGLVLALPFHHGNLEPDCVGASTRGRGRGGTEQCRTRGGEMLPRLVIGWRASALRGE